MMETQGTSCDGCGAGVGRAVCPYCGRHARRAQLDSLAAVEPAAPAPAPARTPTDPRLTAKPQWITY